MEETVSKPRYPRSSLPAKRRGRSIRTAQSPLAEKIMRQLIISICLLVVIGMVKNIHTPFTQFVTEKMKTVLFQNIEVTKAFQGLEDFLKQDKGDKAGKSTVDDTQKEITVTGEDTAAAQAVPGETITQERINEINKAHPFVLPVAGVVTSPFGERIHPLTQKEEFHQGVDLEANQGDPIKAALAGTVAEAGTDPNYGNFIRISDEDGISTVYAHCSQLLVKKGNKIKQGDVVAKVGDTGLSVGTHLHFEVWVDGSAVNPAYFIKVQE